MDKKNHMIWMPLIGFDREQADRGVGEYLESTGFIPSVMSVFIFHPDIINQHENMDKEFTLHPDFCSYFGAPRNEFRERQPWTNYELRDLAKNLSDKGIEAFVGVDGVYLENTRHYEWQSDHLELLSYGVNGRMKLNVLKRFKDGTYYEDFFVDKVVKCLTDYGFAGLHVSDCFCPPGYSISNGDFSADMLDQFASYSNVTYPDEIVARLGFDEQSDIEARQKYIWGTLRREWIDFYVWRWQKFWTKVSTALHAIGKKIMINNAWCADPFEALYRYGIDYRVFYESGADYIIAETVPTASELLDCRPYIFQQYMSHAQMMSVFNPDSNLHTLLGVRDCTEGWDAIHHIPTRLEKDMYYLASMYTLHNGKYQNSTDGYMITLGDGIVKAEWEWLKEREELAFGLKPEKIIASTVVWSDNAHYALLDEYINTRRPSTHKQYFEAQRCNASTGAAVRVEELHSVLGSIFVPNFDLFSDDEKAKILAFDKGMVVCTAPMGYCSENNIKADVCFADCHGGYKLEAFVLGIEDKEKHIEKINEIMKESVAPELEVGDPKHWTDHPFFLTQMPFNECSSAFYNALAYLLNNTSETLFNCETTLLPVLMKNGKYRVYVINHLNNYKNYEVLCKKEVKSVECGGKFPVIPPRFVYPPKQNETKFDGAAAESMKIGMKYDDVPLGFLAKVPPLGISVFDVTFED
ncbi:MAG: hypothetical protein IKV88_07720 [Clostridia bacterium]|nr:hypothetical protein [Clostridia bacterium]